MTSMLTQNLASHKELLKSKTDQIDTLNEQIRELSATQKTDLENLQELKDRVKLRAERQAKVANLRREVEKKKNAAKKMQSRRSSGKSLNIDLQPEWLRSSNHELLNVQCEDSELSVEQKQSVAKALPSLPKLQARRNAYTKGNESLQQHAEQLRAKSLDLEGMYRKVIALCTGVPEDKLDERLSALVAAVESEKGSIGDQEVGRVRDFLRRVDGSKAPEYSGPTLMVNPTISAAAERAMAEREAAQRA